MNFRRDEEFSGLVSILKTSEENIFKSTLWFRRPRGMKKTLLKRLAFSCSIYTKRAFEKRP